ncbi:MAG TPA: hypothetical protein VNA69_16300 [Thermoanaerobaculia bacterium]|nr:hypothetical protein [Thermoanaerobaculia bacterium]
MGAREQIEKQLSKKRTERAELQRDFEKKMNLAEGHIEGLEAALKALPKDLTTNGDVALREGGGAAMARDFLRTHGRPAHITEIVTGIGKEPTHKNKVSLASVMSTYARQGKVFTKVPGKPNTFGLVGVEYPIFGTLNLTEARPTDEDEIPLEEEGATEIEDDIEIVT